MKKIVILSDEGRLNDQLIRRIEMLFPDCTIEIRQSAGSRQRNQPGSDFHMVTAPLHYKPKRMPVATS